MNYLLFLVIIFLGVGGYFEYTTLQESHSANVEKINDLNIKVDAMEKQNKTLEEDSKKLTEALAHPNQQVATSVEPTPAVAPTARPRPPSNQLGEIATTSGKIYQNCHLLKVESGGIVISNSDGITKINYPLLPPELQKRFGYDMKVSLALTPEQVQFQDQQRVDAGD